MPDRKNCFEAVVSDFPEDTHPILSLVVTQAGKLSAAQCRDLRKKTGLALEDLLIRLLPLAGCFAAAPVSGFAVGAIALAGSANAADPIDWYLGANIEFEGVPLNQSIHAEQTAVVNAWLQGAEQLHTLAVSESPCGHCRQFIMETDPSAAVDIILSDATGAGCRRFTLSGLLPEAFTPVQFGQPAGMMAVGAAEHDLALLASQPDTVVTAALAAARRSYAPYSQNFAGCAIQTKSGEIFSGRSIESAAFNPGLTALQAAICRFNMAHLKGNGLIRRVILVEKPTAVSQHRFSQLLLEAWNPHLNLEYHKAI